MSNVVSTYSYVTDTDEISDGIYTVGESLYLDTDTLLITNTSDSQITDIGAIGELIEAPDLTGSGLPPRMVVRLTASDALLEPLKRLLNSTDL